MFRNVLKIILIFILMGMSLFAQSTQTRNINLTSGWNWISFNVLPTDLSLNSVFSSILDQIDQVKSQTQSAIYRNGG
jgi:hypothetical protein